ncbi:hypothetical protein ACIQM0_25515 [Streptomyces sp. NPDC091387]|uniref:hypothetical protein n=1 Tax=Streptomyces sp. NPDC091387 TaxID=3365998 RepID=UPI0038024DA5
MAVTQTQCWIAVCDLCGNTTDADGCIQHFTTPDNAINNATVWGDETSGWTLAPDGRLVCDTVTDHAHESVHQAAGKHLPEPGPDAMCVTFTTT